MKINKNNVFNSKHYKFDILLCYHLKNLKIDLEIFFL